MEIEYLADHKNVIPTLANWSYNEWSNLHPERTLSDVEQLMLERSNKEKIPLCLVAFENDKAIGMIALKTNDLGSRPNLSPWLAGLYVDTKHRKKGVGKKLVFAIEDKAARLGVSKLFLYTPDSEEFYSKLNWVVRERTEWQGHSVSVMEKDIVL